MCRSSFRSPLPPARAGHKSRTRLLAVFALATALLTPQPGVAEPGTEGQPTRPTGTGFWIWTEGSAFSIRWQMSAGEQVFSGRILSTAPLPTDWQTTGCKLTIERVDERILVFEASASERPCRLDLRRTRGPWTLDLRIGGVPAPLHQVHLGRFAVHPRRFPVVLDDPITDAKHPAGKAPAHHHDHPHPHPHPSGLGHHHPK